MRNGAAGYLLKTIEGDALSAAIRRAMDGESVIAQEMTGKLVAAYRSAAATAIAPGPAEPPAAPTPLSSLSPRELDILRCIAAGDSNKEIARKLLIAETTVKIHVQHILRKLNLNTRVRAAVLAAERGLV